MESISGRSCKPGYISLRDALRMEGAHRTLWRVRNFCAQSRRGGPAAMSESVLVEQIYPRLPVFLQNAACWYYGTKEARVRSGRAFEQRLHGLLGSEKWSAAEIEAYQNEKLRRLVRLAFENVPY